MIIQANALALPIADGTVQCCVTSPPYWGLRDYGVAGQLGLEPTPDAYVANMVQVFREVRRVLRDDGTLWLNLGDSYSRDVAKGGSGPNGKHDFIPDYGNARRIMSESRGSSDGLVGRGERAPVRIGAEGLKPKDLVGIPWMVAFALRADGWYLRSDVIWSKPNPIPESVTDRPTRAHEYLFLLTKSARYYYDHEAIKNPASDALMRQIHDGYDGEGTKDYAAAGVQNPSSVKARIIAGKRDKQRGHSRRHAGFNDRWDAMPRNEQIALGSNKRSVWTIPTQPYRGAHFAVMPEKLVEPCVLAGSKPGDLVLDPFAGSGTVGVVALRYGRRFVGVELSLNYIALAQQRMSGVQQRIEAIA